MIYTELPFKDWGLMLMMRRRALTSVAKPVIIKMCADDKNNGNY